FTVRELCNVCGDILLWAEYHQELQEDLQEGLYALDDLRLSVLRAAVRVYRENSISKILSEYTKQ
ncbi:MAG: hypothetical protein ACOCNI_08530, partial [Prevotella pectinovora]